VELKPPLLGCVQGWLKQCIADIPTPVLSGSGKWVGVAFTHPLSLLAQTPQVLVYPISTQLYRETVGIATCFLCYS